MGRTYLANANPNPNPNRRIRNEYENEHGKKNQLEISKLRVKLTASDSRVEEVASVPTMPQKHSTLAQSL